MGTHSHIYWSNRLSLTPLVYIITYDDIVEEKT